MDSLANYGSDEENSNNSDDQKYDEEGDTSRRASDANYDPVQMDMSEESNNNNSSRESSSEPTHSPVTTHSGFHSRTESSRTLHSPTDQRRSDNENHTSNSKEEHKRGDRSDRSKQGSEKSRRSPYDDKKQRDNNHKDSREGRRSRDDERKSRDDDKKKGKSLGSSRDERSDERERTDKEHHYRDDRRDRNRERNDRERRRDRDRDRDRRHSRDDRSKDRHRDERPTYHKDKDRTRSRSRSRDRAPAPFRTMSYREEKGRNKLAQLEKLGIELKAPEGDHPVPPGIQTEQNFYNPLATATQGKYAEQIQKRKLLWAKKSSQEEGRSNPVAATTTNTWVGTTFTHDQDGKVSAKFKRLMGIKGDVPTPPTCNAKPDILKKQEEMFSNMEQQYEVARATTHTQRGVGLGYATGGYQFPR